VRAGRGDDHIPAAHGRTHGPPVEQRRNPPRDPRRIIALAAAGVVLVLILSLVVSQVLIQVFIGPNEPASSSQLSESLSSEESETPQTSSQLPEESSQPPSSSESVALVVPNLVGSGVEAVMINPLYAQLFMFQVKYLYSEDVPVGTVLAQEPEAGELPGEDKLIIMLVSKGTEKATMPKVVGEQVERAIRMLNALEIRFEVIEVFDETHPAGEVLSSSIEADSNFLLGFQV
jgi:serine/threonine-protein kinase